MSGDVVVPFVRKAAPPAPARYDGTGVGIQDAAEWLGRELAEMIARAPYNLSPAREAARLFITETLYLSGCEVCDVDAEAAAGMKAFSATWLGRP